VGIAKSMVGDPGARPRMRLDTLAIEALDLVSNPFGYAERVGAPECVIIVEIIETAAIGPKVLMIPLLLLVPQRSCS
jgi:hypothetical protein